MNVSDQGLRFIADCEGAVKRGDRHVLYNDPVGHCTIGYGHLVHLGNCNGSEPEEFKRGLTEDEAIALKRQDARRFVDAINRLVTVPLTQNQFDALVSLVFNIGEGQGGFEDSTLRRRLNVGDYAGAADAFLMWNKAELPDGRLVEMEGLTNRRKKERSLFLTPDARGPAAVPSRKKEDQMFLFWHKGGLFLAVPPWRSEFGVSGSYVDDLIKAGVPVVGKQEDDNEMMRLLSPDRG